MLCTHGIGTDWGEGVVTMDVRCVCGVPTGAGGGAGARLVCGGAGRLPICGGRQRQRCHRGRAVHAAGGGEAQTRVRLPRATHVFCILVFLEHSTHAELCCWMRHQRGVSLRQDIREFVPMCVSQNVFVQVCRTGQWSYIQLGPHPEIALLRTPCHTHPTTRTLPHTCPPATHTHTHYLSPTHPHTRRASA